MSNNIGNFNLQGLEPKTREQYREDVTKAVNTPRTPEVQAGIEYIRETIANHADRIGREAAENLAKPTE